MVVMHGWHRKRETSSRLLPLKANFEGQSQEGMDGFHAKGQSCVALQTETSRSSVTCSVCSIYLPPPSVQTVPSPFFTTGRAV